MKRTTLAAFLILVFPAICLAKDFSGKEASGHIGSLRERLSARTYSLIKLERRDYDSINHADLDGLIFFPAKIKYHYIRRLNDDHRLKLNVSQGQEAAPAGPDDSARFERLIAENKLFPHVLLDKDGREAFTVYCNLRVKVTWAKEKNNEIYLEVRDPFKKESPEKLIDNSLFGIKK